MRMRSRPSAVSTVATAWSGATAAAGWRTFRFSGAGLPVIGVPARRAAPSPV